MEEFAFVNFAIYFGIFLLSTAALQVFSKKSSFPYTILLLIAGFVAQSVVHLFQLNIRIDLPPEFIFFFLLPTLLFEAAIHISLHQFRLQFKTIAFLATFGLLLSIFIIGFALATIIQMPLEVAFLFGAIISATDPIAVLALFKSLGAPKRLSLVADGESMFNDATGIIVFRFISTFVVGNAVFGPTKLVPSLWDFVYTFFGSLIFGAILGYVFARLVQKIPSERVTITAITTAIAIGGFAAAEHFFRLSGVISVVIAGIVFGNLATGKMHAKVLHFVEGFWEYLFFLSLSLVFFFATYQLNLDLLTKEIGVIAVVVAVVLVARSISVYVSIFLSNTLLFFRDEPNIPPRWQHVLNWGGLRGVVPLVLVYSLPNDFVYKELMLRFTLATLLFTLFVNGLTIKSLLVRLKLHLPKKEEEIIEDELRLFELDTMRQKLSTLSRREFDTNLIQEIEGEIRKKEDQFQNHLLKVANSEDFLKSLKIESLEIERSTVRNLFEKGRLNENVYFTFDSELDLQQDALEYPEVFTGRAFNAGGFTAVGKITFRKRLIQLQKFIGNFKGMSKLFGIESKDIVTERYSLLRVRLLTSFAVLDYLDRVEHLFNKSLSGNAIDIVRKMQKEYISMNEKEIEQINDQYPQITYEYQRKVIQSLIVTES